MNGAVLSLFLAAAVATSSAVPPPQGRLLVHGFGPEASAAPDVEVLVRPRRGEVRRGGATGKERIDTADYANLLVITVHRGVLLGPGDPPVLLEPGTYDGDILPGREGSLRLILRGREGMRVALPLDDAGLADPPPPGANAMEESHPAGGWMLTIQLPTASGVMIFADAQDASRARTRTDVIRTEQRERLMHSGRPKRRPSRQP